MSGTDPSSSTVTHADDLALARACAAGDERAIATFDHEYLGEVDQAVGRIKPASMTADDCKQAVRQKLLTGEAPKIGEYSGHGSLRGWVRVTVVRTLLDLLRQKNELRKEVSADDDLQQAKSPLADPELELMRRRYQAEFTNAFAVATASLTPRQRNLLRHQLVHGLTLDELATVYRIHRATAARWLGAARDALRKRTRKELERTLKLGRSDFASIVRLMESQLHVSVERILGPDDS
jgi:RNA polymerase sigma-70 factor (ECF subfamily)